MKSDNVFNRANSSALLIAEALRGLFSDPYVDDEELRDLIRDANVLARRIDRLQIDRSNRQEARPNNESESQE